MGKIKDFIKNYVIGVDRDAKSFRHDEYGNFHTGIRPLDVLVKYSSNALSALKPWDKAFKVDAKERSYRHAQLFLDTSRLHEFDIRDLGDKKGELETAINSKYRDKKPGLKQQAVRVLPFVGSYINSLNQNNYQTSQLVKNNFVNLHEGVVDNSLGKIEGYTSKRAALGLATGVANAENSRNQINTRHQIEVDKIITGTDRYSTVASTALPLVFDSALYLGPASTLVRGLGIKTAGYVGYAAGSGLNKGVFQKSDNGVVKWTGDFIENLSNIALTTGMTGNLAALGGLYTLKSGASASANSAQRNGNLKARDGWRNVATTLLLAQGANSLGAFDNFEVDSLGDSINETMSSIGDSLEDLTDNALQNLGKLGSIFSGTMVAEDLDILEEPTDETAYGSEEIDAGEPEMEESIVEEATIVTEEKTYFTGKPTTDTRDVIYERFFVVNATSRGEDATPDLVTYEQFVQLDQDELSGSDEVYIDFRPVLNSTGDGYGLTLDDISAMFNGSSDYMTISDLLEEGFMLGPSLVQEPVEVGEHLEFDDIYRGETTAFIDFDMMNLEEGPTIYQEGDEVPVMMVPMMSIDAGTDGISGTVDDVYVPHDNFTWAEVVSAMQNSGDEFSDIYAPVELDGQLEAGTVIGSTLENVVWNPIEFFSTDWQNTEGQYGPGTLAYEEPHLWMHSGWTDADLEAFTDFMLDTNLPSDEHHSDFFTGDKLDDGLGITWGDGMVVGYTNDPLDWLTFFWNEISDFGWTNFTQKDNVGIYSRPALQGDNWLLQSDLLQLLPGCGWYFENKFDEGALNMSMPPQIVNIYNEVPKNMDPFTRNLVQVCLTTPPTEKENGHEEEPKFGGGSNLGDDDPNDDPDDDVPGNGGLGDDPTN